MKYGVWAEAAAVLRRHWPVLALAFPLLVITRLAALVLPACSKYVVDHVLIAGRVGALYWLAFAALVATVVQSVGSYWLSRLVGTRAHRAIAEVQRALHAHVIRLPIRAFDSNKTGALVSRIMRDPEGLQNLVGSGMIQLVGAVITALAAFGVLVYLNWMLTLGTLALLAVLGVGMGRSFRRLRPAYRDRARITADITGRLTEGLGGIRVVKTYGSEQREERVFTRGIHRLVRSNAGIVRVQSWMAGLSALIVGLISVFIMLAGGRAVVGGAMTLGDLVMYAFFVKVLTSPLVQISALGTRASEAVAGLDRIREVRQQSTEGDADDRGESPAESVPDIVLEDVWFEYVPGRPVLRGVSAVLPAGRTSAVVGPSGAGKSTLIALIMGFDRPTSGRVLVGGQDLARLRAGEYRRQLGVVLQDPFLFDGTIRENIAYSRPGASLEEIRRAAALAHCDEFIDRFEQGLETVIGERGVRLSGGQRQRIAIARAILANPRILILDEATSSVDADSEALIREGLRSLRAGRTTVVIAHRLSTILSADQILVLDRGQIVERGTHRELIANGGLYRQLYERQAVVEVDRFANPGEAPPVHARGGTPPPVPVVPTQFAPWA